MSGTALERRTGRTNNDTAVHGLIYDGASINQIAAMFGMANTEVAGKLRSLAPAGVRSGYPIYAVKEAAEYLLKPRVDIEKYIRKVGMKDLPTTLQKDLWTALNGQLKFEEAQGAVFRAERISLTLSEVFKTVRMRLLLAPDEAERQGVMSSETVAWFRGYIDDTMRSLKDDMIAAMKELVPQLAGIIDYEPDDTADEDEVAPAVKEDDEL